MEYQLTAEVNPPTDAPELDALQRFGVAALLDEHLDLLAEIEGPDGVAIEPLDHRIAVHPGGASITWLLDAPALAFAEEAARQVLEELLERTELLVDWSVSRCEVIASDEDLAAALGADPEDNPDGVEVEEVDLDELEPVTGVEELTESERGARREQLLEAAESMRAFGLEAFGYTPTDDEQANETAAEQASLVAGALVLGVDVLIEELFADVQSLEESGGAADEHEVLWILHDLPARYASHYTAVFAKRLLLTTAVLGYRLTLPDWDGPLSVAEALALHLAKSAARDQLNLAELADELPVTEMLESFDDYAFDEVDVTVLYAEVDEDEETDEDIDDELVLVDWFEPLDLVDEDDEDDLEDDEDEDEDDDEDSEDDNDAAETTVSTGDRA